MPPNTFNDINDGITLGDGKLSARFYEAWKQTQKEREIVEQRPQKEDRTGQPIRKIVFPGDES